MGQNLLKCKCSPNNSPGTAKRNWRWLILMSNLFFDGDFWGIYIHAPVWLRSEHGICCLKASSYSYSLASLQKSGCYHGNKTHSTWTNNKLYICLSILFSLIGLFVKQNKYTESAFANIVLLKCLIFRWAGYEPVEDIIKSILYLLWWKRILMCRSTCSIW